MRVRNAKASQVMSVPYVPRPMPFVDGGRVDRDRAAAGAGHRERRSPSGDEATRRRRGRSSRGPGRPTGPPARKLYSDILNIGQPSLPSVDRPVRSTACSISALRRLNSAWKPTSCRTTAPTDMDGGAVGPSPDERPGPAAWEEEDEGGAPDQEDRAEPDEHRARILGDDEPGELALANERDLETGHVDRLALGHDLRWRAGRSRPRSCRARPASGRA